MGMLLEFLGLQKRSDTSTPVKSPADMTSDELMKEEAALSYDIRTMDRERDDLSRKMDLVRRQGLQASGDERVRLAEQYRDFSLDLKRAAREGACLHKTLRLIKRLRSYKERERRYRRPYLDIGRIRWEEVADLVRSQEIEDEEFESRLDRLLGVSEEQVAEVTTDAAVQDILAAWDRETLTEAERGADAAETSGEQRARVDREADWET